MNEFFKLGYYDLKLEARSLRLPKAIGFENEIARLTRITSRGLQHNAIIAAPSGCGKTALLFSWVEQIYNSPLFAQKKLVMLNSATLQKIGQLATTALTVYQEAFLSLENCVLIIDSFGEMIYQSPTALQNWNALLKPLFSREDMNVILTMQPDELKFIEEHKSHFLSHFETIKPEGLNDEDQLKILEQALLKHKEKISAEADVTETIVKFCRRFPSLGQLPKSALQILDEAVAEAKLAGQKEVGKQQVEKIVADKTGIPLKRLSRDDKQTLRNLPQTVMTRVLGQDKAVAKMTGVIQRARLGLRNQSRPLGSFLVLGPSGVGKTETAKVLASELYGSEKHFLRIDMSEFGQEYSTARLLGSPAGYVGFSEGGQLTNHFANNPYSLLLLDEIEKAHSKVFDIFLQILDDGRITSAKGQTVDLSQSIIMATSNLAVPQILQGFQNGHDVYSEEFIKKLVIPELLKYFRMEFINRFDSIIIFKPLSVNELVDIAFLEIAKIEERMKEHKIRFSVTREALEQKLADLNDPRFGARPTKRFIEETCENLITEQLLK